MFPAWSCPKLLSFDIEFIEFNNTYEQIVKKRSEESYLDLKPYHRKTKFTIRKTGGGDRVKTRFNLSLHLPIIEKHNKTDKRNQYVSENPKRRLPEVDRKKRINMDRLYKSFFDSSKNFTEIERKLCTLLSRTSQEYNYPGMFPRNIDT